LSIFKASVQHEAAILWIPNLGGLCDLLCKNFPSIERKGIRTEGRKDHEGLKNDTVISDVVELFTTTPMKSA
jgi:hypothetical protein